MDETTIDDRQRDTGPPAPDFDRGVERHHLRYDASEYDDIYVVGDVHGCIRELRRLWERLSPSGDDLVVFVGDLVRKGPESVAVIEFVAERANAVSIRGNNEAKVLEGRVETDPFDPVREEIRSFPLVVSWDNAMAVHGGVHPERPLSAHDDSDLLETRSIPPGNGYDGPFWFDLYRGPPRVFFGHTVMATPFTGEWAVGLDTGCVYGGELTAYDYRHDEVISVPAERTYQSRSEEKILDP